MTASIEMSVSDDTARDTAKLTPADDGLLRTNDVSITTAVASANVPVMNMTSPGTGVTTDPTVTRATPAAFSIAGSTCDVDFSTSARGFGATRL